MVLESVNFHFWPHCNFNCKYCFAHFKSSRPILSLRDCLEVINQISTSNVIKINFAGGEPTLSPYLGTLLVHSKNLGLKTSIISNGTGINEQFIEKFGEYIDWIGLSIDSAIDQVIYKLGRGEGDLLNRIIEKSRLIKNSRIKLKINTVVNRLNYQEDMSWLIEKINPERWKVFQILEIRNQACNDLNDLLISDSNFENFVKRHEYLHPIVESNHLMLESYLMIDPFGRFYQNTDNFYIFSRPILDVGFQTALTDITYDHVKFLQRGGLYAW